MKRIEVFYQDRKAGELAAAGNQTSFQFAPDFIQSGIQLSPLRMKLRPEPYIYGEADFGYLPPVLSDSLPDLYGRAVMNRWFAGNSARNTDRRHSTNWLTWARAGLGR